MSQNLFDELQNQFATEYGSEPLPAHKAAHRAIGTSMAFDTSCPACKESDNVNMLRQKYGLIAARIYHGPMKRIDGARVIVDERNAIRQERSRAHQFAHALTGGR